MADLKGKWGFDTNLIIYSLDKSSIFHISVKNFLETKTKDIELFVSHQNILESIQVLSGVYKIPHHKSLEAISNLLAEFKFRVISPLPTTFQKYIDLTKFTHKHDIFDYYLAATLLDNKINGLLTANIKDFKEITDLKVKAIT